MKLISFFRTTLLVILILSSLLASLAFGYYQFGNRNAIPEWEFTVFGYQITAGKPLLQIEKALEKLDFLNGQFKQLSQIANDIKQQFLDIQTGFQSTEATAEATRLAIANAITRLNELETSLAQQQSHMKDKELAIEQQTRALTEAEKTIKNLQRQLRAVEVERLDNDALALEYELARLSRALAEYPTETQIIQTSVRRGIVVLLMPWVFDTSQQITPAANDFLTTLAYVLENLPTASVHIVQIPIASTEVNRWHSDHSAQLAERLIDRGVVAERILIASQPVDAEVDRKSSIEIRIQL